MFIYLLTTAQSIIGYKTRKIFRPAFVALFSVLIVIGIIIPNQQPADALFFIPIIAVAVGGFLLNAAAGDPTGVATAVIDTVGGAVGGAVSTIALGLLELIMGLLVQFSGWLITLAGQFLTFVLIDFNQSVGFYTNDMVTAGWSVVRDVANWFFIVMLIVIAIGTILGQEQYGMRRNLLRLVLVAIFMNFSLVFVGIFVNMTQLFMSFFIRTLTSPFQDIGKAIAFQGFAYGQFQQYNADGIPQIQNLANLLFISMFQFVGAFALLFISILLIIRIAQLWLHMIMAPLAFVSTIIPRTQQFFGHWLNGLINWGLFGVIAAFFIWLSTYLMAYFLQENGPGSNFTLVSDANAAPQIQMASLFLRFVTISLFLFASIGYAKSMSGRAGSMVSDGIMRATGMVAAPGLAAGAVVARGGKRLASREITDRSYAWREERVKQLERLPLVGSALSAPFRSGLRGEEAKTRQKFEEIEKELTSPKAISSLEARVKSSALGMERSERAASLMALAKRGKLDKETADKYFKGSFDYLETRGAASALVASDVARTQQILTTKNEPHSVEQMIEKYALWAPPVTPYISPQSLEVEGFTKALLERMSTNSLSRMAEAAHAVPDLVKHINTLSDADLQAVGTKNQALLNSLARSPQMLAAGVDGEKIYRVLGEIKGEITEETRLERETLKRTPALEVPSPRRTRSAEDVEERSRDVRPPTS